MRVISYGHLTVRVSTGAESILLGPEQTAASVPLSSATALTDPELFVFDSVEVLEQADAEGHSMRSDFSAPVHS